MKEIPLTQNQVALVDDEDYERLNAFNWHASWCNNYYAVRTVKTNSGRINIYMHRFILKTPRNMVTDHINHNTLDNRRENLRICTRAQNNLNSRLHFGNITGYKGVAPNGPGYMARLNIAGRMVFYKQFPTLEEAVAAYEEAARKYHGEFKYDPDA